MSHNWRWSIGEWWVKMDYAGAACFFGRDLVWILYREIRTSINSKIHPCSDSYPTIFKVSWHELDPVVLYGSSRIVFSIANDSLYMWAKILSDTPSHTLPDPTPNTQMKVWLWCLVTRTTVAGRGGCSGVRGGELLIRVELCKQETVEHLNLLTIFWILVCPDWGATRCMCVAS